MKKNILFLLCLIVAAAEAQESSFYAKIFGGANFLENTKITENKANYDTGYVFAASFGYDLTCDFHLEGEYAYRKNEISKIHFVSEGHSKHGHFETSSIMANLLWDVPFYSCLNLQPFIGAGIGYDFQRMHASNSRVIFHQKWRHFSWQLMTGLAYPIYCNTELTLEYKFHQGGSHFNNHSVGAGLAYKF